MISARVIHRGRVHDAVADPIGLRLDDGQRLAESEVVWLPPIEARTIFAVGLNYVAHAKELAQRPTGEPLVFLKGPRSLAGHRAATERPADADFMHFECELAVIIGREARAVKEHDALSFVRGYTVANDYVVRDYLENYYRPNLRAKNRDGATLLGPWMVAAEHVPDPQALTLRTSVNGREVQRGNTAHMIYSVARLIEHLSGFMTLAPGDVILTGTPAGVCNVHAGDEVVTAIDGVGTLINRLVDGPSRPAFELRMQE